MRSLFKRRLLYNYFSKYIDEGVLEWNYFRELPENYNIVIPGPNINTDIIFQIKL